MVRPLFPGWVLLPWTLSLVVLLLGLCRPVHAGGFQDRAQPAQSDVCSAVRSWTETDHGGGLVLPSLPLDAAPSPSTASDLRSGMTEQAWAEASVGNMGIQLYPADNLSVSRIHLQESGPQAWIYATEVGSLHNPVFWVFASISDGSRPAHLVAQLGFEGSGPFETTFIRFRGVPYAVTRFTSETGPYLDVYGLDPARVLCSMGPG